MRAAGLVAAALMLAGCASLPRGTAPLPVATPPPDALARQGDREAALGLASGACTATTWALEGRVAVSNGRDGGSGRLDWTQGQGRYAIALSAPVTRQSWRLSGEAGQATLEGVAGGPRSGPDAAALLAEATGWSIPVDALGCWVRGARADAARFGPAELRFAADGRLVGLVQDGWTLEFSGEWRPAQNDMPPLPTRLVATRDTARVRLVVDRWSGPSVP